jgi:hypothetical protein
MPPTFEVLPGLPTYGPNAEPFTATGQGAHREGFVVRFTAPDGGSWVGNFQRGLSGFDDVRAHPNGRDVLVIAGGQGYIVDPVDRSQRAYFGAQIDTALRRDDPPMVIFGNGLWFEAFDALGLRWRSSRISWDGMREAALHENQITGEAWSPLEDRWLPFTLDADTGTFVGGSYCGPAGAG